MTRDDSHYDRITYSTNPGAIRHAMARFDFANGENASLAARIFRASPRGVIKWVKQHGEHGWQVLRDLSTHPLHSPHRTLQEHQQVIAKHRTAGGER